MTGLKFLHRWIPRRLRRAIKEQTLDRWDAAYRFVTGRSHLPPLTLRQFVGGSEGFERIGSIFLGEFRKYGLIRPGDHALDVGCGSGRVARALAADPELQDTLQYAGMDIDEKAVRWCQDHIAKRRPNFSFYRADLHNKTYNPLGKISPANYAFPHPDGQFDLVFLVSIFTNFAPEGLENYLKELNRILKPTGAVYSTWFTYHTQAQAMEGMPGRPFRFRFFHGDYALVSEDFPEDAISYRQEFVIEMAERCGLKLKQPVVEGAQDTLIFVKKS